MSDVQPRKFRAKADPPVSKTETPRPYYQQILKRQHADDEQFYAKSFPFSELIPNWKGEQFDAHLMNAATGRTFKNKHHVKGEGAKKRSDFERFEFAFCLEWIDRTVDAVTFRDRCYNQFTVKSGGCMDHPKTEYKDGPNRVYYSLIRGEVCYWGMLTDTQAPDADDSRRDWSYQDYKTEAEALALDEYNQALEAGREDHDTIVEKRMLEFEEWWRMEERQDKLYGGAKATAARGYSMMGQRTVPPTFMSRQVGENAAEPLPTFSRMTLKDSTPLESRPIATNRRRIGKDSNDGLPDLDAKRAVNQQAKGRKSLAARNASSVKPANEKENFFNTRKNRKPRHADKLEGDNIAQA